MLARKKKLEETTKEKVCYCRIEFRRRVSKNWREGRQRFVSMNEKVRYKEAKEEVMDFAVPKIRRCYWTRWILKYTENVEAEEESATLAISFPL